MHCQPPANERTGRVSARAEASSVRAAESALTMASAEARASAKASHSTVVCVRSLILAVSDTRIRFIFPLAFATESNTSRSLLLLCIRVDVNIDDILAFK